MESSRIKPFPLFPDIEYKENDEWLPLTSARRAKWWYSTVYNVTAMVGVGVLSLPYAMSQLGWGVGVTVLSLSWIITFYTLWQMVEMHEFADGRRFDRYHELGQHAFGKKLGLYIVVPQQLAEQLGINIVYMITGGRCLQRFQELVCPSCKRIRLTFWIMIFGSVHFVLSHLPDMNSIGVVALASAIMSFSYSTVAWATAAEKGVQPDVQYGYKSETTAGTVFHFFSALGTISFSFGAHNVVMEIQATIPSPSKKRMWKGVVLTYVIVALCYFPTAIIGYWVFGNSVEPNILMSLNKPSWLMALANMFVVIHLIGGYQIYAMPVFNMMERLFISQFRFKPSKTLSVILRTVYVAFTVLVAVTLPFFEALLGFFGGFATVPTTYFLPCIIWLILFKPEKGSLTWWVNWACIILGICLMIVAPIGGMRQIIVQAKDYEFYS